MITITYLLNNERFTISESNEHVKLIKTSINNRETVCIQALYDIILLEGTMTLDFNFAPSSKVFLNGYQSWTDTKEFYLDETFRIARRARKYLKNKNQFVKTKDPLLNKFAFDRYGDVLFYHYDEQKLHGYDLFYVKGEHEFFSFNYNYEQIYLIYEVIKNQNKIHFIADIHRYPLKKNEEFALFDFAVFNHYEEGLNAFHQFFSKSNHEKLLGYTSWYNYYQNINEDILLRDLKSLDDRFNLFQIDDGYETFVGDWMDIDETKFPNGLKEIVRNIHNRGFKAGIWLAPFVAEEKSKLFKEHKELFKTDEHGNYIKCGGNWSGFYVLDLEKHEACEYIKKCLKFYMDLGFDFFKLDFLYAISLPIYPLLTRAMITKKGYALLRDTLQDKIILGCGALIFTSYPYFDYLRVGPDVSLKFDDVWFMRFTHRERISTKVTLQNTIYRSLFNQHLFLNDPDVFLLRKNNISLSTQQKESLLIINALFGNLLMTSDNIKDYDEQAQALLNKALELYYHAKNVTYIRKQDKILITYDLNDKKVQINYDTNKGVLDYE